jgi:hypothetical protein
MEYREIVAVTGIGGLFQLLTTKSDGAIVRNLTDKSTKFIPARVHNVTPIESIEIYTTDENVRLHKVLQAMKDSESSTPLVDAKKADNNAIKAYFKAVFPTMDEDRVYVSDMKKILKWYELLKQNDLLNFDAYEQQETEEASSEETTVTEAPAKKAKATKKAADAEQPAEEGQEKPAKKAKAAKKAVEGAAEEAPAKKTARKKKTEE